MSSLLCACIFSCFLCYAHKKSKISTLVYKITEIIQPMKKQHLDFKKKIISVTLFRSYKAYDLPKLTAISGMGMADLVVIFITDEKTEV